MVAHRSQPIPDDESACLVSDCGRPVLAKHLCRAHYTRFKRGVALESLGDEPIRDYGSKAGKKVCKVEGCKRPHMSRGYCLTHYQRYRRHSDLSAPLGEVFNTDLSAPIGKIFKGDLFISGTRLPKEVYAEVRALMKEYGFTSLYAAHREALIEWASSRRSGK